MFRYYRFMFPKFKLFKRDCWFLVHFPCMLLVPIMSIAAFVVVLYYNKWKWVEPSNSVGFAHSIIGIVTIGFSIIQVNKYSILDE